MAELPSGCHIKREISHITIFLQGVCQTVSHSSGNSVYFPSPFSARMIAACVNSIAVGPVCARIRFF